MAFKKGHKPNPEWYKNVGRPKGRKKPNGKNTIDKYPITKEWEKRLSYKVDNIKDIEYYIYNDIPLEEYYKKINNEDV